MASTREYCCEVSAQGGICCCCAVCGEDTDYVMALKPGELINICSKACEKRAVDVQ